MTAERSYTTDFRRIILRAPPRHGTLLIVKMPVRGQNETPYYGKMCRPLLKLKTLNQDPSSNPPSTLVTRSNVDDLHDPAPSQAVYSTQPAFPNMAELRLRQLL